MKRAAELLLTTDQGVGEIVAEVGYIDASSFTRKFTKVYHLSPTAYRKQSDSDNKLK
jgi:AraC-like DNA-binding protein